MKQIIIAMSFCLLIGCALVKQGERKDCQMPTIADTTYLIDGKLIPFQNGKSSVLLEGVSGATAVTHFSIIQSTVGDLNGDTRLDYATVVKEDPGGSGIFYHVAAAVNGSCNMDAVAGSFLGDRIRIESLKIMGPDHVDAGMIIAGMKIFDAEQSYSEEPAFYVTRMFRVDDSRLVEIPQY